LLNLLNINAIASLGSTIALIVFLVVLGAAFVLRKETATPAWILAFTTAVTGIVLVLFIIDLVGSEPATVAFIFIAAALAIVLDAVWRRVRARSQQAEMSTSTG
jgi:drug/metabolite transporter (DMT)-like permease